MSNPECAEACAEAARTPITFLVVKEPYGWAIRQGRQMMRPVWSKAAAVEEAQVMAAALRRAGASAEVWIADADG